MPKSCGVSTRPRPKNSCQARFIVTRAVSGLSRDTSQRASVSREGCGSDRKPRQHRRSVRLHFNSGREEVSPNQNMCLGGMRIFSNRRRLGQTRDILPPGHSTGCSILQSGPTANELVRQNSLLPRCSLLRRQHQDVFTAIGLDLQQIQLVVRGQIHAWVRGGLPSISFPTRPATPRL